jgi:nucleoside-diphosphate-sugar epimerase
MRILFTGATSLAGEKLFSRLREQGHDVVAVSRRALPDDIQSCRVDLELDDLASRLPDESFDVLVHFASFVPQNEKESRWDECFRRNLFGTVNLLEWADGRVNRIMLASSCAVYGAQKLYTPTDEAHPLRPDTAYALSKYGQEQLCQAFAQLRQIPLVVLRLGYVYGPNVSSHRVVAAFIKRVLERQPVVLKNSRTAGLHLIHQDDIAYIGEVLLSEGSGVYNLASPRHVSLIEYLNTTMKVVGHKVQVTCKDISGSPITNYYSCRRLLERHGIQPEITIEQGVASILDRIRTEKMES